MEAILGVDLSFAERRLAAQRAERQSLAWKSASSSAVAASPAMAQAQASAAAAPTPPPGPPPPGPPTFERTSWYSGYECYRCARAQRWAHNYQEQRLWRW